MINSINKTAVNGLQMIISTVELINQIFQIIIPAIELTNSTVELINWAV